MPTLNRQENVELTEWLRSIVGHPMYVRLCGIAQDEIDAKISNARQSARNGEPVSVYSLGVADGIQWFLDKPGNLLRQFGTSKETSDTFDKADD